jgi:serine/threonine-protein kinase HipA
MTKPPLNVFVDRGIVGRLQHSDTDEDATLFGYGESVPASAAVSLTMPVRADQYDSMGGLLPIFEMNLPEGMLKQRLRLQFAKAIPEFDDLDLLRIVGSSQIGRIRYSDQDQIDPTVPEQNVEEILAYKGAADLFAHLLERFATHSGVSGVQPKVLVRGEQTLDKVTHRGATHIVKTFDPTEYPELATNEYICAVGAKAAGILTARVRLSENRRFLVVDRFDLAAGGTYLGIEDFCVLNARRAHGRYDGSYEQIARRITDFASPKALSQALEQYALMVAFASTVGNGDAHLKNFSVLYSHAEDVVELAPAYDMVSTQVYVPRDSLALTMQNSKEFPRRKQLMQFVRYATGKTRQSAARLLDQVRIGAEAAIKEAELYAKQRKDTRTFAARFVAVVRAGLERLAT